MVEKNNREQGGRGSTTWRQAEGSTVYLLASEKFLMAEKIEGFEKQGC